MTLFEARKRLGGQINQWTKASSAQEIAGISTWLVNRLGESDVDIRSGERVGAEQLAGGEYDAVVIATGSNGLRHGWTMLRPQMWDGNSQVPGVEQDNVFTYTDVLSGEPELGSAVMVVDTMGGRQAAIVAEYLIENGHGVEFVTQLGQPSPDLAGSRDWGKIHGRLRRLGVRFLVDVELAAIEGTTVTLHDLYTDELIDRDPVDSVVLVVGAQAEDGLYHQLKALDRPDLDVHLIGDALAPRRVNEAIRDGERVAREL